MWRTFKFKGFTSSVLLTAFFFILCFTSQAKESDQQTIKVGYLYNYGIFSNENNEAKAGYGFEYLNEIAKYTGWNYEFIELSWNEGIEQLKSGEIDIWGPMQKTEERSSVFDFPKREMGFEYGALNVDDDKPNVYYNDTASFDNMKVGTIRDIYYNNKFEEYCKENEISTSFVYAEAETYEEKLRSGEIDAFLSGSLLDIPNTKVVAKFTTEPYYFATTKGNKQVLDGLNMALDNIFKEDAYYSAKLEQKYYGSKSISLPAFTKEEMELIGKNMVWKVVCDPDWAPIEYFDKKDNEFKGANIDILKELSRISGLNFEFVYAENLGKAQSMVDSGKADLLLGYTMQSKGDDKLAYTDSLWKIPIILLGKQNINFTDNLNVGRKNISSILSKDIMKAYPYFRYKNYKTDKDVMDALRKEEIDAAFLNTYVYEEIIRNNQAKDYIIVPTSITYSQCIGVGKMTNTMIVSILNKSIRRLSPEQVSSIVFSNTVDREHKKSFSQRVNENAIPIIYLLIIFFAIILIIVKRNQTRLKNLVYTDTLTGASTLIKLQADTGKVLKSGSALQYVLITLDIDDFKYINDTFGYEVGTSILCVVAKYFKKYLDKDEYIARMSADHFVILCKKQSVVRLDELEHGNANFRELLADILPEEYNITFSIGIYHITDVKESFTIMFDKANFARKSIKGDLNISVAEYTEQMNAESAWKKEVTISMEAALQNQEFVVYLQPKFQIDSEKLVGAEALIRWNHPEKGLLFPDKFIPIFEKNGFVKKIDLFVFDNVCMLLKKWKDKGILTTYIPISVNLSRLHMYNIFLAQELRKIVDKYGISTKYVEIELTESTVFYNTKLLVEIMKQLREAGFLISIDDFGSGYSSLSMLKDIPVDILKIDKGFLGESSEVLSGRVIIESIIKMSKSLNLITVAEGTETKEQIKMLRDMGCDIAQGYYFSKPITVEAFEELYVSQFEQ